MVINMQNLSTLEIDRQALVNNIAIIRSFIPKETEISSVIKGNAYGHGISLMVPLLESLGIQSFSVFSSGEAMEALKVKNQATSLTIMGDIPDEDLKEVMEKKIEQYVFNFYRLEKIKKLANIYGLKARIHLEVETGMNRLGFRDDELSEVLKFLKNSPEAFELIGVCTHFAGAEKKENHPRVEKQIEKFNKIKALLEREGLQPQIYHTACSAATLRFPETRMDRIRVGILQYGLWPNLETYRAFQSENIERTLIPILSWKSHVMAIKEILPGESVGYHNSYQAKTNVRLAVIPVGYHNGFSRDASKESEVIIGEKKFPVVGFVSMNSLSVLIGEEDIRVGDEAILIGKKGKVEIRVSAFDDFSSHFNYETLSRLPESLTRKVV